MAYRWCSDFTVEKARDFPDPDWLYTTGDTHVATGQINTALIDVVNVVFVFLDSAQFIAAHGEGHFEVLDSILGHE